MPLSLSLMRTCQEVMFSYDEALTVNVTLESLGTVETIVGLGGVTRGVALTAAVSVPS